MSKEERGSNSAEKVVVAVKASKEISKTALIWALTHVVQPGVCVSLLVVVPSQSSGRKFWGIPRFAGGCASGHPKYLPGAISEQKCDSTDSCSQVFLQLHDVYDPNKINVKIQIISGSPTGAVSAEAKRVQASWVVIDRHLKHEEKHCREELQCNIVVMKRSRPKVLRLNLVGSPNETGKAKVCSVPSHFDEGSKNQHREKNESLNSIREPFVTPTSSSELSTSFAATEPGTSSVSSTDPGTSPFLVPETNRDLKKEESSVINVNQDLDDTSSDSDSEKCFVSSTSLRLQPCMTEYLNSRSHSSHVEGKSKRFDDKPRASTANSLLLQYSKLVIQAGIGMSNHRTNSDFDGNVRETVSLSRNPLSVSPPLCSICQHKTPVFGKPPRWFSYAELELATGGFSRRNFLAEGGFGSLHRGILTDGQAVAVKQHKLASSQGDLEFCSEVEVLSCAQHRNVVMLIGFCIEDKRRLLVYEYICNGSLDSHLYAMVTKEFKNCSGRHREPLNWSARQKIAVGAARGLRYLHEECRVGCIVHRDMRPNNILITHDFEPLVGDFGLARWQPDGDKGVETRVIGTLGYLAPEYAQSGQITEKADVYSFGVVLLELITGRKAVDIDRPKGQQCLTEWARPLLQEVVIHELIDPRLGSSYSDHEAYCMLHASSLCLRRDPNSRPRISQVLRILEGDVFVDANYMSMPEY